MADFNGDGDGNEFEINELVEAIRRSLEITPAAQDDELERALNLSLSENPKALYEMYYSSPNQLLYFPAVNVGSLVGKRFCHANDIARRAGPDCSITRTAQLSDICPCLLITAPLESTRLNAQDLLHQREQEIVAFTSVSSTIAEPALVGAPRPTRLNDIRHIFIDNDSTFFDAQLSADNTRDRSVRVNFRALCNFLTDKNTRSSSGDDEIFAGSNHISNMTRATWRRLGQLQSQIQLQQRARQTLDRIQRIASAEERRLHKLVFVATCDAFIAIAAEAAAAGCQVQLWYWRRATFGLLNDVHYHFLDDLVSSEALIYRTVRTTSAVTSNRGLVRTPTAAATASTSTAVSSSTAAIAAGVIMAAEEAEDEEDIEQLCIVCMDNPRTQILFPCSHLCLCADCTRRMNGRCPYCQQQFISARSVDDNVLLTALAYRP